MSNMQQTAPSEQPEPWSSSSRTADSQGTEDPVQEPRLTADEELALVDESYRQRLHANELFRSARYSEAVQQYDRALASCPGYLEYEVAVLRCNLAACYVRLTDWTSAIEAADATLQALDRLVRQTPRSISPNGSGDGPHACPDGADASGTSCRPGPAEHEAAPKDEDVARLRTKALMRRARARTESGGWSALAGAEEDYQALAAMANLQAHDRSWVTQQLRALPARIENAKQEEMGEMMGKLKELGNGLLKPFGLSTDHFRMVKDERTGGYNIQLGQGGGAGSS